MGCIEFLKLLSDLKGAVRGSVVHNDQFPVEVVFGERSVEEPYQHWQVATFIVSG